MNPHLFLFFSESVMLGFVCLGSVILGVQLDTLSSRGLLRALWQKQQKWMQVNQTFLPLSLAPALWSEKRQSIKEASPYIPRLFGTVSGIKN